METSAMEPSVDLYKFKHKVLRYQQVYVTNPFLILKTKKEWFLSLWFLYTILIFLLALCHFFICELWQFSPLYRIANRISILLCSLTTRWSERSYFKACLEEVLPHSTANRYISILQLKSDVELAVKVGVEYILQDFPFHLVEVLFQITKMLLICWLFFFPLCNVFVYLFVCLLIHLFFSKRHQIKFH